MGMGMKSTFSTRMGMGIDSVGIAISKNMWFRKFPLPTDYKLG